MAFFSVTARIVLEYNPWRSSLDFWIASQSLAKTEGEKERKSPSIPLLEKGGGESRKRSRKRGQVPFLSTGGSVFIFEYTGDY